MYIILSNLHIYKKIYINYLKIKQKNIKIYFYLTAKHNLEGELVEPTTNTLLLPVIYSYTTNSAYNHLI